MGGNSSRHAEFEVSNQGTYKVNNPIVSHHERKEPSGNYGHSNPSFKDTYSSSDRPDVDGSQGSLHSTSDGSPARTRSQDDNSDDPEEAEWMEWIRQQFHKHTKSDAIDRHQFIELFSTNPEESFFADRLFALFDENQNNTIELEELTQNLEALNRATTKEKLTFLFKIYDIDGDGRIDREELMVVLRTCVKQSAMHLSQDDLQNLSDALFSETDADNDGAITMEEMLNQLEMNPGMTDNLSLSVFGWLKPPKAAQNKKSPGICSMWYIRNNLSYVVFLALYTLVNLALIAVSIYRYWDSNWAVIIARCCGMCLNFNCAFVIVFIFRRLLSWLRSTPVADFLPLDDHIQLHKLVGVVIVVQSVIHTIAHLINIELARQDLLAAASAVNSTSDPSDVPEYWEFLFTLKSGVGWIGPGFGYLSGDVLLVVLLVMAVLSMPCIRRSGYFEVFFWAHQLYVVFMIFLILHGPLFWMFLIGPGIIFIIERIVATKAFKLVRYGKVYIKEIYLLPSKVVHLVIERPEQFSYEPGDYVFLNIPCIALHEWHPFTLSSEPERPDVLWFHVRSEGHWTNRLHDYFEKYESRSGQMSVMASGGRDRSDSTVSYRQAQKGHTNHKFVNEEVYIDGPFGTPTRDIFETEHAILIASGIGVTPYASILQSIVRRYEKMRLKCPRCDHVWTDLGRSDRSLMLNKVDFIWINRNQKCFEWFTSLLAYLEKKGSYDEEFSNFLEMQMFLTGAMSKNDLTGIGLQMAMEIMYQKDQQDVLTGLKTRIQHGRPDFDEVFGKIFQEKKGKVKIFFCGSRALGNTVKVHAEKYGFAFVQEHF